METAIFRIVQEAVTNVFRHSGAREAWVTLTRSDSQLTGTVRDNGKGITDGVMQGRPDRVGVGIGGMRQRVKEFGGDLRIANANPGTCVEVTIPIDAEARDGQEPAGTPERRTQREVAR
jgi:signal transduction histidine kinase